jgi:hypothetical protein
MPIKQKQGKYHSGNASYRQSGVVVASKEVRKVKHPLVTCLTLPFVFLAATGIATLIWLLQNGMLK